MLLRDILLSVFYYAECCSSQNKQNDWRHFKITCIVASKAVWVKWGLHLWNGPVKAMVTWLKTIGFLGSRKVTENKVQL